MRVWKCGRWIACFIVLLLFAHPIAAPAQITAALTHWQSSQWWRNTATLDMDFINDRYWLNGTQYSGVSNFITGAGATFSRNSVATYFNSSGTLTTASANVPRLDHSPISPYSAEGILIEESRTNSDLNSTFSGAVAGSPGSVPNWNGFGTSSGITIAITGSGTEFGMPYLEVNFSGTNSSGSQAFVGFNPNSGTATSSSVTWTANTYVRLVSGALPSPSTFQQYIFEYNSSGTFINGHQVSLTSLSSTTPQRIVTTSTVGSSTASILHVFKVVFNGNVTGNVTIRFYAPQLELGAFPTSYIPTSGSAVTRAADVFTVPTSATGANGAWYTQGVGTLGTVGINPYAVGTFGNGSASIDDGTPNNAIHAFLAGTTDIKRHEIFNGGTAAGFPISAYTVGNTMKSIIAFAVNNANNAYDGVAGTVNTSINIPTALTQLEIGHGRPADTTYWNGWLSRIWYMPTRQPDYSLPDYTR